MDHEFRIDVKHSYFEKSCGNVRAFDKCSSLLCVSAKQIYN